MQNRDSFQRQTGSLQSQAVTKPLARGTRPLMDPSSLRATTEDMLGKARQSLANLEPRIELLLRACTASKMTVPGVEDVEFRHPPSPKGEQIITYLVNAFAGKPELAREVQVGVFRFYEARRVVEKTEETLATGILEQSMLEELKLKLFYLSRYHEEFKGDRVLLQLFPPPQTMASKGTGVLSTVERLKQKQARESILHKAEILNSSLAPKMDTIQLTLDMLDNPRGLNIGALFTPATRTARILALGLGGNSEVVEQLREAMRLNSVLQQQLTEARGGGEVDPLKETIYPLSRLALTCQKHPLLRELFPSSEGELFPDEKPSEDGG